MKLLVVAPYFYPKVGGLENYAWNISKGLKEKYGWDIVVVTSNHESNKYKEDVIKGIKIYRLPYWFKLSNTPINFGWIIDINKIINKEKPDIINAHTPVPFISDIAALVSYFNKVTFTLTYHNDLVKNNILDYLFRIYYSTLGKITFNISKFIITTSEFYAKNSIYLKNFKDKLQIIPPGVDIKKYKVNYDLEKNNTVLFVGQLDKTHTHKGLSNLIESIGNVIKRIPDATLMIVGHGDNLEQYKQEVHEKNLTKNVNFTGYLNDDQLIKAYQKSSVVVLPSLSDSEGFGMTLIEAGACGIPVIGTKVGGIPSVITNNSNGILIPPHNINELSHAIIKVLTNKDLAKKMGLSGYKRVNDEFSWDIQISKTKKLLE